MEIFRLGVKIYIEVQPLPGQYLSQYLINKNRPLNLELSEKLCEKYLLESENEFEILVQKKLCVVNSQLIAMKKQEYLV